jgi:hypothetical protein
VDATLQAALEKEAQTHRLSINQTVVYLLRIATGLHRGGGPRRTFHDLDHLSGTWSSAEAEAFESALSTQRSLDEELWK